MTHQHRTPRPCPTCEPWPPWSRHLASQLNWLASRIDHLDDQLATQTTALQTLNRKATDIMTSQENVDASVTQLTKALGEIRTLVDTLNTTVADLQAQIASGQSVDLTALQAVSQSLDDVVPDAPVEPPVA